MFHEFDSFISKTLRGEAVVCYREPLITQEMGESGSPLVKNLSKKYLIYSFMKAIAIQQPNWLKIIMFFRSINYRINSS